MLDELTRRDLLPAPDRPAAAAADDANTTAATFAATAVEPAQDPAE